MFSIWLPLLMTSSALVFGAIPSHGSTTTTSSVAWMVAVQEFDAFLQDWKKGRRLRTCVIRFLTSRECQRCQE
ncbi:hypothetical protein [Brevibacillus sp. FIR094]|uniref:hypothetical protein n=1 Tax=Brevibacillus sp. FIR094 TaxID=3134809 RepID=UPI003D191658